MICPKCDAAMAHSYCESWRTAEIDGDEVEYVTTIGYWSCYSCAHQVGESDDEYYEPD